MNMGRASRKAAAIGAQSLSRPGRRRGERPSGEDGPHQFARSQALPFDVGEPVGHGRGQLLGGRRLRRVDPGGREPHPRRERGGMHRPVQYQA